MVRMEAAVRPEMKSAFELSLINVAYEAGRIQCLKFNSEANTVVEVNSVTLRLPMPLINRVLADGRNLE